MQDLSNLVWAFARLEIEDEELFDMFASQTCEYLEGNLGKGGALACKSGTFALKLLLHSALFLYSLPTIHFTTVMQSLVNILQ